MPPVTKPTEPAFPTNAPGPTVWKYEINPGNMDEFHWTIPEGFGALTVQVQNGVACLWALVDPRKPLRRFKFRVFGTGQPIPKDLPLDYLGTFQLVNGKFVGHLFRVSGPE